MDWFTVEVEARVPEGAAVPDLEEAAGVLLDLLAPWSGACSAGGIPARWGATISMQASNAVDAAATGAAVVRDAARRAGLPAWPIVLQSAVRDDVADELAAALGLDSDSRAHIAPTSPFPAPGDANV